MEQPARHLFVGQIIVSSWRPICRNQCGRELKACAATVWQVPQFNLVPLKERKAAILKDCLKRGWLFDVPGAHLAYVAA